MTYPQNLPEKPEGWTRNLIDGIMWREINAHVAAEREACALICDEYAANSSNPMNFSENCAAAIRARGDK